MIEFSGKTHERIMSRDIRPTKWIHHMDDIRFNKDISLSCQRPGMTINSLCFICACNPKTLTLHVAVLRKSRSMRVRNQSLMAYAAAFDVVAPSNCCGVTKIAFIVSAVQHVTYSSMRAAR